MKSAAAVINLLNKLEKPKMKKVRPMIDKDLRDEIVNYCGGESFNSALRSYTMIYKAEIDSSKRLSKQRQDAGMYIAGIHDEMSQKDILVSHLKQEI
jgi:hypothetical protein